MIEKLQNDWCVVINHFPHSQMTTPILQDDCLMIINHFPHNINHYCNTNSLLPKNTIILVIIVTFPFYFVLLISPAIDEYHYCMKLEQ